MSNWKVGPGGRLYHPTTGAYVGQLDDNGNEQMVVSAFPSGSGRTYLVGGVDVTDELTAGGPGGGFDGVYDPQGGLYFGPPLASQSPITQRIVKSDVLPSATNPAISTFEFQHDGSAAYIFHLTQGPNMTGSAALIGLGIDGGGRGLFVNNKQTGQGIVITQNSTITGSDAYGLLVNGGKGAAPASFWQQNNNDGSANAQPLIRLHAYRSFSPSQKLMDWYRPDGTTSGTLAGWIRSEDGALIVQDAPLIVSGADLTISANVGTGGAIKAVSAAISGAGSNIDLYNTSGTADKRRFRMSVSSSTLVISGRNDAGASTGDLLQLVNTTQNVGLCGGGSYGGGSKVVFLPDAATVPASNPTGGGILFSEGGALKWRGSAGTVTTIAAA